MKVSTWQNCYDDNWTGLIVPEAFSHPAKFAPGLIRRIYQHCLERGYLKKGDTVVDPFGGIGAGGIMAAYAGLNWIGVELETKFVTLAIENFELHEYPCSRMGYPLPVILQGDSRRLSQVLGECSGIVTSPPFMSSDNRNPDGKFAYKFHGDQRYSDHDPIDSSIGGDRNSPVAVAARQERVESTANIGHIVQNGNAGTLINVESYWQAVADVYRECHKILKPGGVIVIVVKSYVKAGRRVPLPMQTLKLLIHLGFEPLERIKASLVKKTVTPGLFGEITKKTEKKSFFRRLAEKRGSPEINFEEVLACRK